MFGVVSTGLMDNTVLPEPVDTVTPVPPLATGRVPEICEAGITKDDTKLP